MDLYVARVNASIVWDGRRRRLVRAQTVARAGHPILEAHAAMFEPLRVEYDVEQATARPGEKREVRQVPQRPPTSGPGSGVDAWRRYAAAVTGEPESALADMSRDELVELTSPREG